MRRLRLFVLLLVLVAACAGPTAETTQTTTTTAPPSTTTTTQPPLPEGDFVNGGLLYDKWWAAAGVDEPTGDSPLWATQSTNTRSGGDTWRCKECHGWDYLGADGAYGSGSHFTGFPGILGAASGDQSDLTAMLTGEVSADHDFSPFLSEQAIADLVAFISEGLEDYSSFVGDDKSVAGDTGNGATLYDECTSCHGVDGRQINFGDEEEPEYLGTIALANPWEFFHKVRYGQPGSNPAMPSAIAAGWSLDDVRDVIAFAQSLPTLSDAATDAIVRGGLLYDKWWSVVGGEEPEGDSPIWARQDTNTRSGGDTWRCKECHGWDYMGVDGAYGSGSHLTGFPGVFAASAKDESDLSGTLTGGVDPEHDFSEVLSEEDIAALVAFLQGGVIDMSQIIDLSTKAALGGDETKGSEAFASACSSCHGADGTELNFGSDDEPEYVGTLAVDNPWETVHKILFGHPGSAMPAQFAAGWELGEVADLLAYLQTLP